MKASNEKKCPEHLLASALWIMILLMMFLPKVWADQGCCCPLGYLAGNGVKWCSNSCIRINGVHYRPMGAITYRKCITIAENLNCNNGGTKNCALAGNPNAKRYPTLADCVNDTNSCDAYIPVLPQATCEGAQNTNACP